MNDEITTLVVFLFWLIFTLLIFVFFCREERGKSTRERNDPITLLVYASCWPIYFTIFFPLILIMELITWVYEKIAGKPVG